MVDDDPGFNYGISLLDVWVPRDEVLALQCLKAWNWLEVDPSSSHVQPDSHSVSCDSVVKLVKKSFGSKPDMAFVSRAMNL